ncbi:MAG TPA: hypothetical protein VMX12_03095 [Acidimicrobiia bacterium]|nr:hypothetical protein [Acidimicrobiia bacterium]
MRYAVATPSRGTVHSRTIEAVLANVAEVDGFAGWVFTHDQPIPDCDELAAERALATGADLVWFVEEDVIPPAGALRASIRVLEEFDVAGVDYPVGAPSEAWGCMVRRGDEILWCGLGATLVPRYVFERLARPWFSTDTRYLRVRGEWEPHPARRSNAERYGQQDIYFSMQLRAAGMRIGAVPGMTAGHAKVERYGGQGTNVGWHTISVRERIDRQYPG